MPLSRYCRCAHQQVSQLEGKPCFLLLITLDEADEVLSLAHPAHTKLVHLYMYISYFSATAELIIQISCARSSHDNWVPLAVLNNCLPVSVIATDKHLDQFSSEIKYPYCLFDNNVCIQVAFNISQY